MKSITTTTTTTTSTILIVFFLLLSVIVQDVMGDIIVHQDLKKENTKLNNNLRRSLQGNKPPTDNHPCPDYCNISKSDKCQKNGDPFSLPCNWGCSCDGKCMITEFCDCYQGNWGFAMYGMIPCNDGEPILNNPSQCTSVGESCTAS